jgi:hypothetical protein
VIGAIMIGAIIYILLQIAFLAALPKSEIGRTWATGGYTAFSGPFANLASLVGLGGLATILYIDAVISPAGTGLIYTTGASRVSYGSAATATSRGRSRRRTAAASRGSASSPRSSWAASASCRSRAGGRSSA